MLNVAWIVNIVENYNYMAVYGRVLQDGQYYTISLV